MSNDSNRWTDLRPEHIAVLEESAIKPEIAQKMGVRSSDQTKALIIPYRDRDGETVVNMRRLDEVPKDGDVPRYLWPKDTPAILSKLRDDDGESPIVLVEGTKQALAVDSWLRQPHAVYGMNGCYGWTKSDLSWMRGRKVFVIFDADVSTNRDVHTAAVKLFEALKAERAEPLWVPVPGTGNDGIDDVLARRPEDTRSDYLTGRLEDATAELPKPPAAQRESKPFFDKDNLLVADLAENILEEVPAALTREQRIAVYRDGVYQINGVAFMRAVTSRLHNAYRHSYRKSVEEYATALLDEREAYLPNHEEEPILNLRNGMLDLRTGELMEHDPSYMSSVQLPVEWDPDAECPTYKAWLRHCIPDQIDDLEEVASTMLDMSRTPPKAIFLFGPSRSGKSTFLRLMRAIAGADNTAAVSLHQLSNNKFAAANVYGKVLNSAAELSAAHVEDLTVFKMMTGEDEILADRKYGGQFQFVNKALFAFSANEPPTVGETSRAYFERIKPFRFGRSFAGKEDKSIEAAMMRELPGILVRWVRAWQRLERRGGYQKTNEAVLREFETASDRVRQWLESECVVVREAPDGSPVMPGTRLPSSSVSTKRELYAHFHMWIQRQNTKVMAERKFSQRLMMIDGVTEVRSREGGGRGVNVVRKDEE